ncbi:Uncharacterised protein [Yersinia frederiksenii]|nr:Uncharacterised protein [Yersinia frederiksenii]
MQFPFEFNKLIINHIIHSQAGWGKQGDDGLC